jgi:RNA polymerase sigma-70 factor, ECF subfamily
MTDPSRAKGPSDPNARRDGADSETVGGLKSARAGDASGFAALYERTAPSLHGWAALRIHPSLRTRLDPDDLVQEVWWRAMDAFGSFDPEKGSFRAWLFRIASNVLLDGFRRLRTQRSDDAARWREARRSRPEAVVAEGTSISLRVSRNETLANMIEAVSSMEEDDRALFFHCALEGLAVADAAPLIGIGEEACAKRWQRLKARLRESPEWRGYFVDVGGE